MLRYLLIIIILMVTAAIFAAPEFYPWTQVGEAFLNTSNAVCNEAVAGLNVVEDQFHNGEFFSMRYYSQSAGLSNPYSEARVNFYDILTFPTVIFNGTEDIIGGGPSIINGTDYALLINQNRFAPSPIKMQVGDYNSFYGTLSITVTMMSSTYSLQNQSIRFVLVQTGLPTDPTNIIREVITQPITLSGLNNSADFNVNFDTEYYGIVPEFWVAAFVQLDNGSIIQAVSILPQPFTQIRAVFPFSSHIVGAANTNYSSADIWFFNTRSSADFTIRLLADNAPAGWYFNYCDENGACYPGYAPNTFHLNGGENKGFHLNLIIGSSGTATFHFIVEADGMEPYIIPFTYQTETANDDQFLSVSNITLMQNFPNPFSSKTSFRINAKQSAEPIEILIYNCKGQRVQSVKTPVLKAGMNELNWEAKDKNSDKLSSGIYFYRIKGKQNSPTQKMLIVQNN